MAKRMLWFNHIFYSQTAQLIEALHTGTDMPSGIVIANDSDYKRSYMLVHQSARLPSPSLMVTNLDASLFPSLKLPPSSLRLKVQKDPGFGTIPTTGKGKGRTNTLLFDRILCDVPCSGDGTIRKNLQLWNSWQPNNATGIHVYVVLCYCGYKIFFHVSLSFLIQASTENFASWDATPRSCWSSSLFYLFSEPD